jgi:hypothetical protein
MAASSGSPELVGVACHEKGTTPFATNLSYGKFASAVANSAELAVATLMAADMETAVMKMPISLSNRGG